mmetsp:Transcript_8497/g.17604  ORF Transcript_8497/g.17604 Transcript_8497/m.17604 type:complete len:310 (-) Transcript_8497:135-1064(-)
MCACVRFCDACAGLRFCYIYLASLHPQALLSFSLQSLHEAWLHRQLLGALKHLVDEPVLHGTLPVEVPRALAVTLDLDRGLAGGGGDEVDGDLLVREDLLGADGYIRRLAPRLPLGLRQGYDGVRERVAAALLAHGEEHGRGALGLAEGDGVDGGGDVAEAVGDGKGLGLESHRLPLGGQGARGVYVHVDGLVAALVVQEKQLGDDELRHGRYEGHADVHNTVVKEEGGEVWGRADPNTIKGLHTRLAAGGGRQGGDESAGGSRGEEGGRGRKEGGEEEEEGQSWAAVRERLGGGGGHYQPRAENLRGG